MDIDSNPIAAKQFSITSVPTLVLFRNANEVDRVIGADTSQIVQKVQKVLESNNSVEKLLVGLINKEPVMVFIKGTPTEPRCGFTRTLIGLLNNMGAKYGHFDILSDSEVRQSLKVYSKWPTYPQLYVRGNLIGGLDIVQVIYFTLSIFFLLNCPFLSGFTRKWGTRRHAEGVILLVIIIGCPYSNRQFH